MFEQLFDSYRKTSESWLQMQQDVFKQLTQQWSSTPPPVAGTSTEWNRNFQKRWGDLAIEMLNKHREALDWLYKSGIQILEQSFRVSEAKSPEDYRRMVEDLWRKLFDSIKTQSEAQFRDLQRWADKSIEIVQTTQA